MVLSRAYSLGCGFPRMKRRQGSQLPRPLKDLCEMNRVSSRAYWKERVGRVEWSYKQAEC
jgi:hypothetical protein